MKLMITQHSSAQSAVIEQRGGSETMQGAHLLPPCSVALDALSRGS